MPRLLPLPHFLYPSGPELPAVGRAVRDCPAGLLTYRASPGILRLDIAEERSASRSLGYCGLLAARAFRDGGVLPHEQTLTARLERQRRQVIADRGALGKPVLLATTQAVVAPNSAAAITTQQNNGTVYTLRPGPASALNITAPLIIADGHHRAQTHAELAAEGYTFCDWIPVIVMPLTNLHIGAFALCIDHRVPAEVLFSELDRYFTRTPITATGLPPPPGPGYWSLCYRGVAYLLRRRDATGPTLDVRWLHERVLPEIFGITDARTDLRLLAVDPAELTPDIDTALIYLLGHPLDADTFLAEVTSGHTLPPKSTRFLPRVPTGLVVWQPESE